MTEPGWYADPDGTSTRQRWWDGEAWTPRVRPEPPSPRGPSPWQIALAVLIVATLSVWAFLATASRPEPSPATAPSASLPAPDPSGSRPPDCAPGGSGTAPESGDTLVNGRLSMAAPDGWRGPSADARAPLTEQMWGYSKVIPNEALGWQSTIQTGLLAATAPADSAEAARAIMQCILTSEFYASVSVRVVSFDTTQVTVDGTPAVRADAEIAFVHRQLTTKGSKLRLVVVATEPTRAVFLGIVPKENTEHQQVVEAAQKSLRVVG